MIIIKSIPDSPSLDPRFLDVTDVPFILLAIICLFIAYYILKKKKKDNNSKKTS